MIRTERLPKNVVFIGNKDGFNYFVSLDNGIIYEVKVRKEPENIFKNLKWLLSNNIFRNFMTKRS